MSELVLLKGVTYWKSLGNTGLREYGISNEQVFLNTDKHISNNSCSTVASVKNSEQILSVPRIICCLKLLTAKYHEQ